MDLSARWLQVHLALAAHFGSRRRVASAASKQAMHRE
jgi:hypothetical protein